MSNQPITRHHLCHAQVHHPATVSTAARGDWNQQQGVWKRTNQKDERHEAGIFKGFSGDGYYG